jgi:hypothetical protein
LNEQRDLAESLTSLEMRSAALVERRPDGTLRVPEGSDAVAGVGTAAGGLMGMLAGVLGGPLGVLLGFGTGALVGGAFDLDRATRVDDALALLSAQINTEAAYAAWARSSCGRAGYRLLAVSRVSWRGRCRIRRSYRSSTRLLAQRIRGAASSG